MKRIIPISRRLDILVEVKEIHNEKMPTWIMARWAEVEKLIIGYRL